MFANEKNNEEPKQYKAATDVYSWGNDSHGQLGIGNHDLGRNFLELQSCDFSIKIDQISCGESHAVFTSGGFCYGMGDNTDGRLGVSKREIKSTNQPCLIQALTKYQTVRVSCGSRHSAAIISTGELFTWGFGGNGQLGLGSNLSQYTPQLVQLNSGEFFTQTTEHIPAKEVSCGSYFTGVVSKSGDVYMFGKGEFGQLGTNNKKDEFYPVKLKLGNEKVDKIACGINHTLVATPQSRVYSYGANDAGQLGIGNKRNSGGPYKVVGLENLDITAISAGYHSAAITFKGDIYIWGPTPVDEYLIPQPIQKKDDNILIDLKQGDRFSLILDVHGALWGMGNNSNGQLCQGDNDPHKGLLKLKIPKTKKVRTFGCGKGYVVALGHDRMVPDHSSMILKENMDKSGLQRDDGPNVGAFDPNNIQEESKEDNMESLIMAEEEKTKKSGKKKETSPSPNVKKEASPDKTGAKKTTDAKSPEKKATTGAAKSPDKKTTTADAKSPEKKATTADAKSPEKKAATTADAKSPEKKAATTTGDKKDSKKESKKDSKTPDTKEEKKEPAGDKPKTPATGEKPKTAATTDKAKTPDAKAADKTKTPDAKAAAGDKTKTPDTADKKTPDAKKTDTAKSASAKAGDSTQKPGTASAKSPEEKKTSTAKGSAKSPNGDTLTIPDSDKISAFSTDEVQMNLKNPTFGNIEKKPETKSTTKAAGDKKADPKAKDGASSTAKILDELNVSTSTTKKATDKPSTAAGVKSPETKKEEKKDEKKKEESKTATKTGSSTADATKPKKKDDDDPAVGGGGSGAAKKAGDRPATASTTTAKKADGTKSTTGGDAGKTKKAADAGKKPIDKAKAEEELKGQKLASSDSTKSFVLQEYEVPKELEKREPKQGLSPTHESRKKAQELLKQQMASDNPFSSKQQSQAQILSGGDSSKSSFSGYYVTLGKGEGDKALDDPEFEAGFPAQESTKKSSKAKTASKSKPANSKGTPQNENDDDLEYLLNELESLKQENDVLNHQLVEKDGGIVDLEKKILALEKKKLMAEKDVKVQSKHALDDVLEEISKREEELENLRRALQENKEDIDEFTKENEHLDTMLKKYGPGFIQKENDVLRELTKNVLQLRYLDRSGPHTNKETKKKLEEKVSTMMEEFNIKTSYKKKLNDDTKDNSINMSKDVIVQFARLYKKRIYPKKVEEPEPEKLDPATLLKAGPEIMTQEVLAGHKKMAATFVRNSSRGSLFGEKLGLTSRTSYNSLNDTSAGLPNPNQLIEILKTSRRASNSSVGNSIQQEKKRGLIPNYSCSSLSDLSSTESTYHNRDSLTKFPIRIKTTEEHEDNLPVESPKAILSQPFKGLIGMMTMNKVLTN